MLSRETFLLINNVLFTAAALAVLIGTLYPLALDVLSGEKISVGPPYFQAVFLPLVLPALALMGVGTVARWKSSLVGELWRRLRVALVLSLACAAVLALAGGWMGVRLSRPPCWAWPWACGACSAHWPISGSVWGKAWKSAIWVSACRASPGAGGAC
jgi:cytochrome c biogenesis factor